MNPKNLFATSAAFYAAIGISFIFLPKEISSFYGIATNSFIILIMQALATFYFAFALLNWMIKGAIIGGIYNKPIVMANFAHCFILSITLTKFLIKNVSANPIVYVLTLIYVIFSVLFWILSKKHPNQ